MDQARRRLNERKFGAWDELPAGGGRYWFWVYSRSGWRAKYVKEVDRGEKTTNFRQEIYNEEGVLVEIHEKYPEDKGHWKLKDNHGDA